MGRGRGNTIPYRTQKAVAIKFRDYMEKENARPKTRTEMRELYSVHFRPYLTDQTEKRVLLGQVLYNLKGLKVVEKQPDGDKETIVYRNFPTVAVDHNVVPNFATTETSGEATGSASERQEPEDEELAVMVAKLKKDLVSKRKYLTRDKGDISIHPAADSSDIVDMGVLNLCESKLLKLTVRNESDRKVVLQCSVLGSASNFTIKDRRFNIVGNRSKVELLSLGSYVVEVKVTSQNPGIHRVPVGFEFKREDDIPFHIVKFIKAETTDDVVEDLQPTSPYVRPKPVVKVSDPEIEIIDGQRPPFQDISYTVPLERYPIPSHVRYQVNQGLPVNILPSSLGEVSARYHCERLGTILHIEELQMEVDIQRFSMENAKLERDPREREYLTLRVPGLAENRPSLVRGDWLFVRKLVSDGSTAEKKEYKGFVHKIGLNQVYLKFSRGFHENFITNSSYRVRFDFRRTPLKLMHRALNMASGFLNQMPSKYGRLSLPLQTSFPEFSVQRWYDSKIGSNEEQKQAVKNIVNGTSHPYPYLVFGPPGTGKTVTLVESIKQVFDNYPDCKILACAPSNSAADLMLERVSENTVIPKHKMVRLNAYGRSLSAVSESIKALSKTNWDPKTGDYFCFPPKEEIMGYQLVVTTLISAGRLVSMGIGDSHFTHVFIDEAGHGMQPECFVAIAGLLGTSGDKKRHLVLAGDPKQLGPVLRSPLAIEHGLDVSFLERLMSSKFPCFNRRPSIGLEGGEGYDAKMVTKLLNNYRSHPAIIELPNELFYENELRVCADQLLRESLCRWDDLPKKGFPVIFESVFGKDMREERSPSFFNPQEVSVVLRYVRNLKEARGVRVDTKDIGIISPYHKQVQKIRESLKKRPLDIRDIKVGSVEEFQGQERKVIIISTVRSSEEFLDLDATHKLGFLRNPKRFNVAITRAKALLVVIGNPKVLLRDEHWRSFIQFCKDNDSCRGAEFEMPEREDEQVLAQFEMLNLREKRQEDEGDLSRAAYEGLPWRRDDE